MSDDAAEPDRFGSAPHPRCRSRLVGQGEAEQAFLRAWRSGRLPHTWLLGGARGIGKATLAYRIAAFVLSGGRGETLDVHPDHPAVRQARALSHPNLVVLRRAPAADGKAAPLTIPVDSVRRAMALFGATAADAGYRIGIVDSAEDLGVAGANALLKLIEEPPPRSLFLIVSHHPGRVLPTIRSRCRLLPLRRLSEPDLAAAVRSLGAPWDGLPAPLVGAACSEADGSVRQALEALDEDRIALRREIRALLDALPRLDLGKVAALAEAVAKRGAEERFRLVLDTVLAWASAQINAQASLGPARLAPLAALCERAAEGAREAEAFNLDRRPLMIALFGDLAEAVRATRLASAAGG